MRKATMQKRLPFFLLLPFLFLGGCASDQPPQPAQFWGGVGFSYEADKVSGGRKRNLPAASTHIGFEKELGGGFGIGMEVAGVAAD
jgi:hypothetical protein